MEIFPPKKIKIVEIKGKGRGVVATENISKGEIIEYCPILFISEEEVDFLEKQSKIMTFYYLWQPETGKHCIMFGYGSMYNHSKNPNAEMEYDIEKPKNYLHFRAIKDIKAGEEILFDYFDYEPEYEVDEEKDFLKLD